MDGKDVEFLLKSVSMWMTILSTRMMLILTLLLTFGLFAWAMYLADYMHLATAAAFGLLVFLPIRALDAPKKEKENDRQTET